MSEKRLAADVRVNIDLISSNGGDDLLWLCNTWHRGASHLSFNIAGSIIATSVILQLTEERKKSLHVKSGTSCHEKKALISLISCIIYQNNLFIKMTFRVQISV